ncbi:MAG: tRNA pseudouridine(55) synthase TruB [Bacteroidota bacterium]
MDNKSFIPQHPLTIEYNEGKVLLVNKPSGWTSFDVVQKIRNVSRAKKVGHAGTLDPLATGLLILCTGKFTKRIDEVQAQEKEYTGTITVGATRPSFDVETEIDQTFAWEHITPQMVQEATQQFTGVIEQIPPSYSAIKINGQRAYENARAGKEVEIKPRSVEIKEFEITGIELPNIHFRVMCSKGTYIRTLAFDFGRALNSGAYLASLCRTRIGEFLLKDAVEVEDLVNEIKEKRAVQ